MMATTVVWTESVTVPGARNLPPVTMPKPIQMAAKGDQHAEQAKVDLRRRDHAAQRRPGRGSAWLGLVRCRPGPS